MWPWVKIMRGKQKLFWLKKTKKTPVLFLFLQRKILAFLSFVLRMPAWRKIWATILDVQTCVRPIIFNVNPFSRHSLFLCDFPETWTLRLCEDSRDVIALWTHQWPRWSISTNLASCQTMKILMSLPSFSRILEDCTKLNLLKVPRWHTEATDGVLCACGRKKSLLVFTSNGGTQTVKVQLPCQQRPSTLCPLSTDRITMKTNILPPIKNSPPPSHSLAKANSLLSTNFWTKEKDS